VEQIAVILRFRPSRLDAVSIWPCLLLGWMPVISVPSLAGIVPAAAFWPAYRVTARRDDELLARIRVPIVAGRQARFRKIGTRRAQAISKVVMALAWRSAPGETWSEVRLALGSVAATPIRAGDTEAVLEGSSPTRETADAAAERLTAEIEPIDDVRSTAVYRRMVAGRAKRPFSLDSKVPEEQELIASLPKIGDHLCGPCREHFAEVKRYLELLGIPFKLDARLVRGLDYYVKTTFEVVSGDLGAQNSVLGGGRYDGLVRDLGGPDIPGVGFALGLERLVLILPPVAGERRCDVFLAPLAAPAVDSALRLQHDLRASGLSVLLDPEGRSFKSRMKLADRLGARFVAILGDDEMARGVWSVRDMTGSSQEDVPGARVAEHLKEKVHG
jgi:hypothetical protein